MRTRTEIKGEKRLVDICGWMAYTGLGRNKARELAEENNLVIKIGRRVLYDLKKADEIFDRVMAD